MDHKWINRMVRTGSGLEMMRYLRIVIVLLLLSSLVFSQKLSGRVITGRNVVLGQRSSGASYVGNSDPGLLITAVNLSNLRSTAANFTGVNGPFNGLTGSSYYSGFGFFTLLSNQVPAIIKGICRYKVSGNSRIHRAYIIDDIDPCGNLIRECNIDMSVGSPGDWICSDFTTPWDPSQTSTYGVSHNVLVEEGDNLDQYYWEDTTASSMRTQFIYPGNIAWTTYANPDCTTLAGNESGETNHLFGPVNLVIANPSTAGDTIP